MSARLLLSLVLLTVSGLCAAATPASRPGPDGDGGACTPAASTAPTGTDSDAATETPAAPPPARSEAHESTAAPAVLRWRSFLPGMFK